MDNGEHIFRDLVHRQRDLVWRVCSSYRLSAAWTTEDAFHEVLCNLWRSFPGFDGRSSERTWVFRVAVTGTFCVRYYPGLQYQRGGWEKCKMDNRLFQRRETQALTSRWRPIRALRAKNGTAGTEENGVTNNRLEPNVP